MRRTLGKVKFAEHFEAAAEAEQLASFIEEYAVSLVPGLLQTERYARAVYRGFQPHDLVDSVDRKIANRLERARILDNPETPRMWAILNENVIRAVVGGPEAMAEQLRHVAVLGRSGRVLVQVLPHRVGAHATMSSMVSLMRFDDAPDMVYVEGLLTGALTDELSVVRRYRDAYDLARAASLPPEASLDLLDSVAEEYDHERSSHH